MRPGTNWSTDRYRSAARWLGTPALESSGGVVYTTASDALHCNWWCMAWMQLLGHRNPWSSLRTVLGLIWRPHEVWSSVAIDCAESRRPLCTMCLSIRWLLSVSLHGRTLRGWVAVVPKLFHVLIIKLTVDCGTFRSEEMSRLDLLHRCILWQFHAGIHWAPESDTFFHKCL